MARQPYWDYASSLLRFRDDTQTQQHSSVQDTDPSQRPLPDNTQHSQERDIHASGGIRTRTPENEQSQTYALGRVAIGIDIIQIYVTISKNGLNETTISRKTRLDTLQECAEF
jgi:hypothetical protein